MYIYNILEEKEFFVEWVVFIIEEQFSEFEVYFFKVY